MFLGLTLTRANLGLVFLPQMAAAAAAAQQKAQALPRAGEAAWNAMEKVVRSSPGLSWC